PFLVGEALELVGLVGTAADPVQDAGGDGGIEQGLAVGDPAHGVDEIGAADLLEDVAGGAGHDGGEQGLVVLVGGQDQGGDRRVDGADVTADVDAGAVGQSGVEDGDVRAQRGNAVRGVDGRAGLADDLDVAFAFEQVAQAV